jgi:hypothetical protein
MPYIAPTHRPRLDALIDQLASEITDLAVTEGSSGAFAGPLNYSVTRLLLRVAPLTKRYWVIALITGVVHNVLDEFYRRYGVPYEDEQIRRNGDVYPPA